MHDLDQTQDSGFHGWWRWPLVPFAAFLGALLGAALIVALQWFSMKLHGGMTTDGWMYRYILPGVQSVIFGYLYAFITCMVAPRAKVVTGIVMVTLLGALTLVALAITWFGDPSLTLGDSIRGTILMLLSLAAAIQALLTFRSEQGWV